MTHKLVRHGNDFALIIDQEMLDRLEIDADTPLDISTTDQALIVTPRRGNNRKAALETAIEEMDHEYGPVFKRLAE
ncbi:MAG TPA: AbrB/MazE/SpoVT family DNA-binding domain-containing protein [Chloroflexia bacterium]|nr:AbrB/MazE/SpoVT family DNA-binding domain-containing protein [Chloroflexia bacterium]